MGKVKSEGMPMSQVAGYEVSTDGGQNWEEAEQHESFPTSSRRLNLDTAGYGSRGSQYESFPTSSRRLNLDTAGYAPGQTTIIVRAVGVDGKRSAPTTFSWVMPGVPAPSGLYFDPNDNS